MGILPIETGPDATLPAESTRRPEDFLEASGERMACFGTAERAELWMWPFQVLRDLRVELLRREHGEPLELARHAVATPAGYRVVHAGHGLELVQEVVADRTERALLLVFSLAHGGDGELDLELRLRLTPSLRAQWPAAVGGRVAHVDEETGALVLTEELGRVAVLIGSPEAEPLAAGLDHGLAEEPLALRIPFGTRRARRGVLPVFVAGAAGTSPPLDEAARLGGGDAARGFSRARAVVDAARERWRRLHTEWPERVRDQVDHARAFLKRTASLECDDADLERAFRNARLAIERAWVRIDSLAGIDDAPARGLVAGIGPSHGTERPGFAWFFNGDALCGARAQVAVGDLEGAREVLRLAARTQRPDGKLSHELVLSLGLCDWLGEYPYAYYKANQTPGFVNVAWTVVRAAGDRGLARELAPSVRRALEWGRALLDGQGLLPVPRAGIAAVEAGPLAGRIHAEVYLQGIWCDALRSGCELLRMAGEEVPAWLSRAAAASSGIAGFWRADSGRHGFAELRDGSRCDDRSAYLGLALARGLDSPERCLASAASLNHPLLASDWGPRMFGRDAEVYDPEHYNTGSVFPYLANFAVLACYRAGLPLHGHQLLSSQVALDGFDGPGFVPEYLTGDRARTTRRAVPHQVFSSSTIVQGVLHGLLGLDLDATQDPPLVRLAPSLPLDWTRLALGPLTAGGARVEVLLERTRAGDRTTLEVQVRSLGGALHVALEPRFPPGSQVGRTCTDGEEVERTVDLEPSGLVRVRPAALRVAEGAARRLRVDVREGPALLLRTGTLERDAPSHSPRIVEHDHQQDDDGTRIAWGLHGPAGTRAHLPFHSDLPCRIEGARLEGRDRLVVEFPPGADFTRRTVTLQLAPHRP